MSEAGEMPEWARNESPGLRCKACGFYDEKYALADIDLFNGDVYYRRNHPWLSFVPVVGVSARLWMCPECGTVRGEKGERRWTK